jgi:hypothetical protein
MNLLRPKRQARFDPTNAGLPNYSGDFGERKQADFSATKPQTVLAAAITICFSKIP